MSGLVFLDTETTTLALKPSVIWEVAAKVWLPSGEFEEYHRFVQHDRDLLDLPPAFLADYEERYDRVNAIDPVLFAEEIEDLFNRARSSTGEKPHLVGMVPDFDAYRIRAALERARLLLPGQDAPWHHHLVDVEALTVGYLAANQRYSGDPVRVPHPPWRSDDVSHAAGVDPADYERHTAMGDVLWAEALYRKVMFG